MDWCYLSIPGKMGWGTGTWEISDGRTLYNPRHWRIGQELCANFVNNLVIFWLCNAIKSRFNVWELKQTCMRNKILACQSPWCDRGSIIAWFLGTFEGDSRPNVSNPTSSVSDACSCHLLPAIHSLLLGFPKVVALACNSIQTLINQIQTKIWKTLTMSKAY